MKNQISLVATDGHRLSYVKNEDFSSEGYEGSLIIPKKFLNLILTLLDTQKDTTIWVGENHMTMAFGQDIYYTRIIGEKFPDYDGVIPKENDKELTINRENILSAVRRVSVFSNRSTQQIALVLTDGKIQIMTEDPEKASKGKEEIVGKYKGEDLTIGYNAAYLKDILSHLPSEKITIKLNTSISAALFFPEKQEKNENLTMLLMPIRLND